MKMTNVSEHLERKIMKTGWNTRSHRAGWGLLVTLAVLDLVLCAGSLLAKPRPVGPPLPEISQLFHESFDEPLAGPTNQVIDPAVWLESWSGYALNRRQSTVVVPWVVPLAATNGGCRVDPQRGALRFFYMPTWSSASTGQGGGPGSVARLLTLGSTNAGASAVWWSLAISENGNDLALVCQTESGPAVCMSAPVSFQAGVWHCVVMGYSETNSALIIDGQQVAAGNGLAALPANVLPFTSLVVGSSLAGSEVASGQIEELSAFTGVKRPHRPVGQGFGVGSELEIASYCSNYLAVAALGPISEAEETARREWLAAARATRLAAAQAAAAASALTATDSALDARGGRYELDSYDPSQGFSLTTPQVQGTNLLVSLVNNDTNISYDIYYSPVLVPTDWRILATGHIAQTSFTVPMLDGLGFLKGGVGGDWDLDGIPNWMDANPTNANVGPLSITIDNPSTGTTFN